MNYFAHGRNFVDDPYFLAGTAAPDWLSVADRQVRVRSRHAAPFCSDADPALAALAAGIVRHHADDGWFHQTRVFAELCLQLTVKVRDALPPDEYGLRPSFLGHILVELLLDAALIEQAPQRLAEYYATMERVEPALVQAAVNRMAPRQAERLARFIAIFCSERFLYDYSEDAKLLRRLNQVMGRVRLPELPEWFTQVLSDVRPLVAARQDDLCSRLRLRTFSLVGKAAQTAASP